jgi:hypothetical protein
MVSISELELDTVNYKTLAYMSSSAVSIPEHQDANAPGTSAT